MMPLNNLSEKLNSILFMVIALTVVGNNVVKGMLNVVTCKGVDLDIAEKHMMEIKDCVTEAGAKEMMDIETGKMACFGKCVMVKSGIIDAKGKPHRENIKKMIKDKMPAVVHDALDKEMDKCLSEESTTLIEPEDESCTTYLPLMMCMHNSFLEVCQ